MEEIIRMATTKEKTAATAAKASHTPPTVSTGDTVLWFDGEGNSKGAKVVDTDYIGMFNKLDKEGREVRDEEGNLVLEGRPALLLHIPAVRSAPVVGGNLEEYTFQDGFSAVCEYGPGLPGHWGEAVAPAPKGQGGEEDVA
jgi:hypothetical protein